MRCNHFDAGTCRSCSLLPQPYERQLAGKAEAIAATLSPVPGVDEIAWLAPASSPLETRRQEIDVPNSAPSRYVTPAAP